MSGRIQRRSSKKVVILRGKRVIWEDEMRVGLIVKHRKVWIPKGEKAD